MLKKLFASPLNRRLHIYSRFAMEICCPNNVLRVFAVN